MPLTLPTKELRARLRASLEALATSVDRTRQDEGFREFLRTAARFWEYSPFNQFLIELQRPRAVRVAGRRTWESLKRRVKVGELPISILAPSGGGGFIFVPVYDLSQTRGRRLPNIPTTSRRGTRHVKTLERAAGQLGIALAYVNQADRVGGRSLGGRIEVDPAMHGVARVRVLAHELGHELLHQEARHKALTLKRPPKPRNRAVEETEADATAFIVLSALGLEAESPSYIAWQGGTGAQVLLSMGRIQRAARRILVAAEKASPGVARGC
jgi:hypothetical protein